jgi:hypothetical protein
MNPFYWPREHQLAWALATGLGGVIGLLAALMLFPASGRLLVITNQFWGDEAAPTVILALKVAFAFGAALTASVFYLVKLVAAGNSN